MKLKAGTACLATGVVLQNGMGVLWIQVERNDVNYGTDTMHSKNHAERLQLPQCAIEDRKNDVLTSPKARTHCHSAWEPCEGD